MEALAQPIADATTILTKAVQAGVSMAGLVLVTRWLDGRAGVHFSDVAAVIRKSPAATADYFGKRLLALAVVVAATMF